MVYEDNIRKLIQIVTFCIKVLDDFLVSKLIFVSMKVLILVDIL